MMILSENRFQIKHVCKLNKNVKTFKEITLKKEITTTGKRIYPYHMKRTETVILER